MKKIIKPFLIGVIGILIGIFSTIFWTKHQPQKPINFSITNKNVVPKNVSYSSNKLQLKKDSPKRALLFYLFLSRLAIST